MLMLDGDLWLCGGRGGHGRGHRSVSELFIRPPIGCLHHCGVELYPRHLHIVVGRFD